jgi:hypothetical protein
MSSKTFLQLQTALASMYGYEDPADLPTQDLVDIKAYINQAEFECRVPTDGTRAMWPEKYHSGMLKAPVSTTLVLTNGSKTVTGYAFDAASIGSYVKVGDKFFRTSDTNNLVQPWDGVTGSYDATVYFNAYLLPWDVVDLAGIPNLLGIGTLAPLPGPDAELLIRSDPAFDFDSRGGSAPYGMPRSRFRLSSFFDVGDPRFYYIDQASVAPTFTLGNRFQVYPLPDRALTFEVRANVVPAGLVADADVPQVPAQAVDNILLPIAREILALNSSNRRYTGPNVQQLTILADRARAQLKSMRRVQTNLGQAVRTKSGW